MDSGLGAYWLFRYNVPFRETGLGNTDMLLLSVAQRFEPTQTNRQKNETDDKNPKFISNYCFSDLASLFVIFKSWKRGIF